MIRTVVLPSSIDGIVTGCILAIGRIVGESAVLMFTAGMGMRMANFGGDTIGEFFSNFFGAAGSTLTVSLYVYAKGARGLRRGLRRRGRAARYRLRHKPRREIRRQEAQENLSAGRAII